MQRAVDAVLLDQHAGQAGAAGRGDAAAQGGMVDADQQLHGAIDQNAAHQPIDRRRREIGEHLLRAERNRQVVMVEHLLRAAVEEAPDAQQQVLEAVPAVADGVGRLDEGAAQQGAHRRGVVEVLGADREIVGAAKERRPPAPVPRALPILVGLGFEDGRNFRGHIGHQPATPIGFQVIVDRRRQQSPNT